MSKRVNYRVEQLLKQGYRTASPQQLRDSDKVLLLAYWSQQGLELTNEQKAIFMQNCDIAESITRERRRLSKQYPASKQVEKQRRELEYQTRKEYSPHTPILQGALV